MKKLMKVLPVVFAVAMVVTSVFADIAVVEPNQGNAIGAVTGLASDVWATVVTIVQILAVAAVVFAGLRYMFASADQKADIKKSMGILAVGAILVFAATTIVQFVVSAAQGALQ